MDWFTTKQEWSQSCILGKSLNNFDIFSLISGLEDGTIAIWHVTENRLQILSEHLDAVTCISFSPDGQYLATLDNEEKLIIWSTEVLSQKSLSPNANFDNAIWRLQNWVIIFHHFKPANENWNHIRWNPTSNKLAISSNSHEVIQLFLNSLFFTRRSLKDFTSYYPIENADPYYRAGRWIRRLHQLAWRRKIYVNLSLFNN